MSVILTFFCFSAKPFFPLFFIFYHFSSIFKLFKLYGNALYLWRYSFLFYSSVSAGAAFDPSADFGAAGFFGASFFFGES